VQFHIDPASFQRDREKQNRVQLLGWTVYRFTWRQLVDQPEAVIRILASITAR
jgi:very-short-patch-repair endonuclease